MLEDQEHTFPWEMILNHEADLEEGAFTFQYTRDKKAPRWVRIYTPYVCHGTVAVYKWSIV